MGVVDWLDLPGATPSLVEPVARTSRSASGAAARANEVLRGTLRVPLGALVHLLVDHRQREEPEHAHRARRRRGAARPTCRPSRSPRRVWAPSWSRCSARRTSSSSPRTSTRRSAWRRRTRGWPRDPAPPAHGADAARGRARQRLADRGHLDPDLGDRRTDLDRLASRLGLLTAVVRSIPRHVWLDHGFDPVPAPTL